MRLSEVIRIVEGKLLTPDDLPDVDVVCACGADLMSDVLTFAKPRALLLTGLANSQVVRTAEVAEIAAVVLVRGKRPDADALALAADRGIPLIASSYGLFELCGRLWQAGLSGCVDGA